MPHARTKGAGGPALSRFGRRQFGAALLGAVALPLGRAAVAATPDDTQANVAVVRRFLEAVVNGGRIEEVDQLWTRDMRWHGASMGDVEGIAAFEAALRAAVGGSFTRMHLEIKDVVAAGDKVVVRFTNSGVNSGGYRGQAATGRFALWEGIGIYRLERGRIAEGHFVEDLFGQLAMLDAAARNASSCPAG